MKRQMTYGMNYSQIMYETKNRVYKEPQNSVAEKEITQLKSMLKT